MSYLKVSRSAKKKTTLNSFGSGVNFFTDEATLSLAQAKDCYNFDFSDGALKEGYGIKTIGLFSDKSVNALWHYKRYDAENGARDDRFLAVTTDGELYERKAGVDRRIGDFVFTSTPKFINYRLYGEDVVLICSNKDGMVVYDGVNEPYKVDSAPKITSLALHGERLFVTVDGEKNAVWFSDDLDPTNWDASLTGGGFIQMLDERGALNKVISYLGYLFVFRDYGITRISAIGAQTEFSVSNLFVSGGRIYPETVAVCGDSVIFLAEDGLYAFDGLSASRVLKNLDGLVENGECAVGAYSAGKYYLAFRRVRSDDTVGIEYEMYQNNALLVLELASGRYALSRGFDIRNYCFIESEGMSVVTADGQVGKIAKCGSVYGVPLKKRWRIPKTDMSAVEKKRVKEIYLHTDYPCIVTLDGDDKQVTLRFNGSNRVQRKRVSFADRRIGVDIVCESEKAHITRPSIITVKGSF